MKNLNIILLDDFTSRAEGWAAQISQKDGCQAHAPDIKEVSSLIALLYKRRKEGRNGKSIWEIDCAPLDNADILIIDYDLQDLEGDGEWTTGTEVAYVARLVTKAKLIVVINQKGANRFDLTLTKGVESRADLDVGGVQLNNPGLWCSSGFQGYRPWTWPNLLEEPARVDSTVEFVRRSLDLPVLATLGFSDDPSTGRHLRPELWGRLCPKITTTFRELVAPEDEDLAMHLLYADITVFKGDDLMTSRIAAAVVRRWLEKWILPNQDILMDIPHLALRFPWILTDPYSEGSWKALQTLKNPGNVRVEIEKFAFEIACFLSRPVYWGDALEMSASEFEPKNFDFSKVPNLVFREDLSNFGSPDISRDFPSQVLSIDNRRWISEPHLEPEMGGPQDVRVVVFEPQSLLLS